jgi:hypothetical protein
MKSKNKYQQLKEELDVRRWLGLKNGEVNIRCPSASHNDKDPSCTVFSDGFLCHGCGWKGDICDYMVETGQARTNSEAYNLLTGNRGKVVEKEDKGGGGGKDKRYRPPAFSPFPEGFTMNREVAASIPYRKMGDDGKWEVVVDTPAAVYLYRLADGRVCTLVSRYNLEDDKKVFKQWCWDRRKNKMASGNSFLDTEDGKNNHPLYNLGAIIQNVGGVVVVVEGEKCAEHLNKGFVDAGLEGRYVATTFLQGCKSVKKTDLQPLREREVLFWADNDKQGKKAMVEVAALLGIRSSDNARHVKVVAGAGNDCADIDAAKAVQRVVDTYEKMVELREREKHVEVEVVDDDEDDVDGELARIWADGDPDEIEAPVQSTRPDAPPPSCTANCTHWLQREIDEGSLQMKFNELRGEWEVTGAKGRITAINSHTGGLTDPITSAIQGHLERRLGIPLVEKHINAGLDTLSLSRKNRFHPVKDYLKTLEWDGVERLNYWFAEAYEPDPMRCDPAWVAIAARKFLIGAVARVLGEGFVKNDNMFLIESNSGGVGKSEGMEVLFFGHVIYMKKSSEPFGEDALISYGKHWLVSDDDFSVTSKKAHEDLKTFLSLKKEDVRRKYARNSQNMTIKYAVVGSVNIQGEGRYLPADDNLRRFWVVSSGKKAESAKSTIDYLKRNRDQLWAEAVKMYSEGELWWLTKDEEIDLQNKAVASRRKVKTLVDKIDYYLVKTDHQSHYPVATLPQKVIGVSDSRGIKDRDMEAVANRMSELGYSKANKRVRLINDDGVSSKSCTVWCWVKKGGDGDDS